MCLIHRYLLNALCYFDVLFAHLVYLTHNTLIILGVVAMGYIGATNLLRFLSA